MGHERTPSLPKTQRWRDVVDQISAAASADIPVATVVQSTLENIRARFRFLESDTGVCGAFAFIVRLSVASRSSNLGAYLADGGIDASAPFTPINLAVALERWIRPRQESLEYAELARAAASDALATWYAAHPVAPSLFQDEPSPSERWTPLGTGSGFCELARLFFARFTERHLKYFLSREASAVIATLSERDRFDDAIRAHIDSTSRHAFETAQITQSFAAGWFNRHAQERMPADAEIVRFVRLCFGKLREELGVEGVA